MLPSHLWLNVARRTASRVQKSYMGSFHHRSSNKIIVQASKKNLPQSAMKIGFLISLIRDRWVPDALAQLKFSPKHRAVDVAKIVKRAVAIAKVFHNAIPEELIVKEVTATKGLIVKKMRIMGRGRTGFGYKRHSHVIVKLGVIDFPDVIENSTTPHYKGIWRKRMELVKRLKEENARPVDNA